MLLDTFEDVGDRVHRDLERLIQRVVWLMPNALFIITARNRLQWDDPKLEVQLDWAAPECWPLLVGGAAEEPRQHTVGYLSAEDCEIYLCERLTIAGRPLMDDCTRHLITVNSHGLPLYLDLAVMRFLDLYRCHDRALGRLGIGRQRVKKPRTRPSGVPTKAARSSRMLLFSQLVSGSNMQA